MVVAFCAASRHFIRQLGMALFACNLVVAVRQVQSLMSQKFRNIARPALVFLSTCHAVLKYQQYILTIPATTLLLATLYLCNDPYLIANFGTCSSRDYKLDTGKSDSHRPGKGDHQPPFSLTQHVFSQK